MSGYEMPTETGEARLHRLRDRRRRVAEVGVVMLALLVIAGWLWRDGTAQELGWGMLWFVPVVLIVAVIHVAVDITAGRVLGWLASPLTRRFDPHSYSRPEPREEAPDWSRAERIPELER